MPTGDAEPHGAMCVQPIRWSVQLLKMPCTRRGQVAVRYIGTPTKRSCKEIFVYAAGETSKLGPVSYVRPHLLGRRGSAGFGRVIGRPNPLSPRGGRTRTSSQAGRVSCATRRCPRAGTKPVSGESRTQDRLHLLLHTVSKHRKAVQSSKASAVQ